jgi:hypothetical protein
VIDDESTTPRNSVDLSIPLCRSAKRVILGAVARHYCYGWNACGRKTEFVEQAKALVNKNCSAENSSYDPGVPWSKEEDRIIQELVTEARKIVQTARRDYLHAQLHELRLISQPTLRELWGCGRGMKVDGGCAGPSAVGGALGEARRVDSENLLRASATR